MVKDNPDNPRMIWCKLFGAMTGAALKAGIPDPENKNTPDLQKLSGQTYSLAKELIELGIEVEIPQEVLERCEPKPAAAMPEPKGVVKTLIEAPIILGGGVVDKVKGAVGKLWHSELNPLPHKEEE